MDTDKKAKWFVVAKNLVDDRFEVIPADKRLDDDDTRYADFLHIVPSKEEGKAGIGIHDFTEDCCCHPKIQKQVYGRTLIIHTERTM